MQARALAKVMEENHAAEGEPFTVQVRGVDVTFVDALISDRDGEFRQLYVLGAIDKYLHVGVIKEEKA
jgi:hypothetical protein